MRPWLILAALFAVRSVMGFQFQSVASISPFLLDDFSLSYADLGILIGVYLLPGIVVALPGGWLGDRFSDKRVVLWGLFLMALGGALFAMAESYGPALIGRALSGTGAVLLNVLLAKMIADWFDGKKLVTAMGILVASWPFGIGLGLIGQGAIASSFGWQSVMASTALASIAALGMVAACYRPPPGRELAETGKMRRPMPSFALTRTEMWLVSLAGLAWALYNVGYIILLSFGPDLLVENGFTVPAAGATISLAAWLIIASIPLGGALLDRFNVQVAGAILSLALMAALIAVLPAGLSFALMAGLIGIVAGPPAGAIMAMPAQAVPPERRAFGMGVYFTWYYVGMAVLPAAAGWLRDITNSSSVPFWFAAILLAGTIISIAGFSLGRRRSIRSEGSRRELG